MRGREPDGDAAPEPRAEDARRPGASVRFFVWGKPLRSREKLDFPKIFEDLPVLGARERSAVEKI